MSWSSGFQLRVIEGRQRGQVIPLEEQIYVIGRSSTPGEAAPGHLFFYDQTVSRIHAEFRWNDKKKLYFVHHKSKTNPTLIEGTPTDKKTPRALVSGNRIQMGLLLLEMEPMQVAAQAAPAEPQRRMSLSAMANEPERPRESVVGPILEALSSLTESRPAPSRQPARTAFEPAARPAARSSFEPAARISIFEAPARSTSLETPTRQEARPSFEPVAREQPARPTNEFANPRTPPRGIPLEPRAPMAEPRPSEPPPVAASTGLSSRPSARTVWGESFSTKEPPAPGARENPASEGSDFLERDFESFDQAGPDLPLGFRLNVAEGPDRGRAFAVTDTLMIIGKLAGANDPRAGQGILLNDQTLPREAALLIWQSRESTYGIVEAEHNTALIMVRRTVSGNRREIRVSGNLPVSLQENDILQIGETTLVLGRTQGSAVRARPAPSPGVRLQSIGDATASPPEESGRSSERTGALNRKPLAEPVQESFFPRAAPAPPKRIELPQRAPEPKAEAPAPFVRPADDDSFGARESSGTLVGRKVPRLPTEHEETGKWVRPVGFPSPRERPSEPSPPAAEIPFEGKRQTDEMELPQGTVVPRGYPGPTRLGPPQRPSAPRVGDLDPSDIPTSIGSPAAVPPSMSGPETSAPVPSGPVVRPLSLLSINSKVSAAEVEARTPPKAAPIPPAGTNHAQPRPAPKNPGAEPRVQENLPLSWPWKNHQDYVLDFLTGPNKGCQIAMSTRELHDDKLFKIGCSGGGRMNDIPIESPTLTNQAATLRYRGGRFGLLNEGPDDSLLINRMPLKRGEQVVLMTGDRIDLGDTVIRFLERKIVEILQSYQIMVESGVDQDQDRHYPFSKQRLLIGRARNCDVQLNDLEVSRVHVAVVYRDGKFFIQHRSETNPTFLNGVSLLQGGERLLQPGDRVRLSSLTLLQFVQTESPQEPKRGESNTSNEGRRGG